MEITATSIYPGPSIYAQQPVVHFALAGTDGRQPLTRALLGALCAELPGLRTNPGACGAPESFGKPGAGQATGLSHLFEHLCIELQNRAGAGLSCIRGQSLVRLGAGDAVVPYEESEVCVAAARLALEMLAQLVPAEAGLNGHDATEPVFAQRIEELTGFAATRMLPAQDRALLRTARALDIPASRLAGRILVLGHGRFQRRLSATKSSLTNVVSNDIAANKDYSRRVLAEIGLPVPRYERVYSAREAAAAARRIGYPVVVKPNNSNMGVGVSVGMTNRREVSDAYRRAREFDRSVLVEELVKGAAYRLLVIDGKLRAAARCVPGYVVGNGIHTIEELLAEVNSDPRRGSGPACTWTPIDFDDQADRLIAALGMTRLSIPRAGEIVYLRRNANTSAGGSAIDVTDDVHPDNRYIAERAARAIGLDIAGVDLLTPDISVSMWKNGGQICEINSRPGVRKHLWPTEGRPRDVLTPIIDMLFPPGRPGRIPIVAITGTGDTRTTAHMLAHVLTSGGRHVGLSAGRRIYSGGRPVGKARLAGPAAARMVLLDPDVDVAVLEIRPDDMLRHGLGCDAISIAAIVSAGAAAPDGSGDGDVPAGILQAIRAVARCARDVVFVADADPCAAAIERDGGGAQLCRIGAGKQAPAAELLQELSGVEAAAAMRCAGYALAAARHLGMEPREIYRGLRGFSPLPARAGPHRRKRARSPASDTA